MNKKCALVTGSAKGIGRELIKELSKNYNVVIVYNTSKKEAYELYDSVKDISDSLVIKCDITNEDEIKNILNKVINKYGKLDLLINNAAYAYDNYIDDKTKEEFMKVLEVNVVGTFLVTKYFYKYMNNGTIVNISSTDAVNTYSNISMDYCASKAAVNSLTKTFALEFKNIKVIGVMPNWTKTESVMDMNPEYLQSEMQRIGQNKLSEPNEVAKNIIKLLNDKNVKSGDIMEV